MAVQESASTWNAWKAVEGARHRIRNASPSTVVQLVVQALNKVGPCVRFVHPREAVRHVFSDVWAIPTGPCVTSCLQESYAGRRQRRHRQHKVYEASSKEKKTASRGNRLGMSVQSHRNSNSIIEDKPISYCRFNFLKLTLSVTWTTFTFGPLVE